MSASIMGKSQTVNHSLGAKPIWYRLLIIFFAFLVAGIVAFSVVLPLELVTWRLGLTAWMVCVISSLAAHVVGEYPSGKDNFAARFGLSVSIRSLPPFVTLVGFSLTSEAGVSVAFVLFTVLFYLLGLFVDVGLQVQRLRAVE